MTAAREPFPPVCGKECLDWPACACGRGERQGRPASEVEAEGHVRAAKECLARALRAYGEHRQTAPREVAEAFSLVCSFTSANVLSAVEAARAANLSGWAKLPIERGIPMPPPMKPGRRKGTRARAEVPWSDPDFDVGCSVLLSGYGVMEAQHLRLAANRRCAPRKFAQRYCPGEGVRVWRVE